MPQDPVSTCRAGWTSSWPQAIPKLSQARVSRTGSWSAAAALVTVVDHAVPSSHTTPRDVTP